MPIYPGLPEDDYRKHPAVSNSDLKVVTRSAAHYLARRNEQLLGLTKPPTQAKLDGRALHTAVLEPMLFMEQYCVLPENAPNRPQERWRKAKDPSIETLQAFRWWDEWNLVNGSRITLTQEKYDEYMGTAQSIRNNPAIAPYFEAPGESELSVFANDPETGVEVKSRQDRGRVQIANMRVCLDLKSTQDARKESFRKDAVNYGYFRQAAFYTDVAAWAGEPIDLFLFVAFEKEAPYAAKLYEADPIDVEIGREENRVALNTYAECLKNNSFPGYDDAIEVLSAPSWARSK